MVTDQYEKIDNHVEKAERSFVRSLIDPLGLLDVHDAMEYIDED